MRANHQCPGLDLSSCFGTCKYLLVEKPIQKYEANRFSGFCSPNRHLWELFETTSWEPYITNMFPMTFDPFDRDRLLSAHHPAHLVRQQLGPLYVGHPGHKHPFLKKVSLCQLQVVCVCFQLFIAESVVICNLYLKNLQLSSRRSSS